MERRFSPQLAGLQRTTATWGSPCSTAHPSSSAIFAATASRGENDEKKVNDLWFVDGNAFLGTKHNQLEPHAFAIDGGFNIASWLQAYGRIEREYTKFKHDGMKEWMEGINLGGGVGLVFSEEEDFRCAIRLAVVNSLNKADWQHTVYQVSLASWDLLPRRDTAPFVELGYRYNKSHSRGISDCSSMFFALGLIF